MRGRTRRGGRDTTADDRRTSRLAISLALLIVTWTAWLYVVMFRGGGLLGVALSLGTAGVGFAGSIWSFPEILRRRRSGDPATFHYVVSTGLAVASILIGVVSVAPRDAEVNVDRTVLNGGLLTPEDLPAGWGYLPESEVGGPAGIAAERYCDRPVAARGVIETFTVLAEAPQFLEMREYVFSIVAAFKPGEAARFLDAVESAAGCGTWAPNSDPSLRYHVERLQVEIAAGDEGFVLEVSNTGGNAQLSFHAYVRTGDVVGLVVYNDPDGGAQGLDVEEIVEKQARSVEDVAGLI